MFVDKEYILKSLKLYQAERAPKGWNDAMQRAIEVVEDAPSLETGGVGEWRSDRLVSTSGGTYGVRRCSVCEAYYQDIGNWWNFCPNCGAYMRGE